VIGAVRGGYLALVLTIGLFTNLVNQHTVAAGSDTSQGTITIAYDQSALSTPTTTIAAPVTTTTMALAPTPSFFVPTKRGPVRPGPVMHASASSDDTYKIGKALWWTWTYDKTAYQPTADDPTHTLPLSVQEIFACIRYTESRNHPNSVNVSSGAQGLYQFLPYLWTFGASALGIKAPTAMAATPQQQSAVAVWFYNRNNGFYPEWTDGCS